MKVVTVLGARPQFIKAATISRILAQRGIEEVIVHTGQHYDQNMSDIFFQEMSIPAPNHLLATSSKHHGEMTGRMIESVEKILINEKSDVVLVYGDTNSTLAGALSAVKLHIPVAHVEAGLRSFNRRMPEEINRVVTDHISEWLFAPTRSAVVNLGNEGIPSEKVFLVGDVMYDAILFYRKVAKSRSSILQRLKLEGKPFVLATIHRAENTNDPERLRVIFDQFRKVSKDKTVVLPLHPRTKSYLGDEYASPGLRIIDPVGYFDMIVLQETCRLIVTDSGGVQKEAFFNGKYCITVREETEWVELVENKFNFLAKPLDSLGSLVETLWDRPFDSRGLALYGIGHSAEDIVDILRK